MPEIKPQFSLIRGQSAFKLCQVNIKSRPDQTTVIFLKIKTMGIICGLFGLVLLVVLLLVCIEIAMRLAPDYKLCRKLPGPYTDSIIGILKFIYSLTPEKAFSLAREWAQTHQQTYVTWNVVKMNLEVIRAHEMEIILSTSKHTQKGLIYELLRPFLGDGLLNSNGKKWQQRRRILTPTFHFSILQQFLTVFK